MGEVCNRPNNLMTKDPYHTPGYEGFCPQFKYQIGQTFGKTTSKLLQDKDIASSGNLVLADIRPSQGADEPEKRRDHLLQSRKQSWGNQKLVAHMVPGYTGFIPKGQHYFGSRYAEGCRYSISDFETDQRTHKSKMQQLTDLGAAQCGRTPRTPRESLPPLTTSHTHPLKPIADYPKPYKSPNAFHFLGSPYHMNNNDSKKNFMSGYTGFVPRSRGLIGMGYPIITNKALNEFTDDVARSLKLKNQSVTILREEKKLADTNSIYPMETGLVPHYTGHIPGQKFRYGETFGHSTENAMSHPLTART